jgi:hypothetical protein
MFKWLENHPVFGFVMAAWTFIESQSIESLIDSTTPVFRWASLVLACGIALLTFILKLIQVVKILKKKRSEKNLV